MPPAHGAVIGIGSQLLERSPVAEPFGQVVPPPSLADRQPQRGAGLPRGPAVADAGE